MKLDKAIRIATESAKESKEKHKIGAILFDQSQYVTAFNHTHGVNVSTRRNKWSEHAEASVINHALHLGFDLTQSTLVVVRVNKVGNLMLAKPCSHCEKLICRMEIPITYYSNDPFRREILPKKFKSLNNE